MGADQMMCGWVEVRIVDMVVTGSSSKVGCHAWTHGGCELRMTWRLAGRLVPVSISPCNYVGLVAAHRDVGEIPCVRAGKGLTVCMVTYWGESPLPSQPHSLSLTLACGRWVTRVVFVELCCDTFLRLSVNSQFTAECWSFPSYLSLPWSLAH